LATAMLVRDQTSDLTLATHDGDLQMAAKALGFVVEG